MSLATIFNRKAAAGCHILSPVSGDTLPLEKVGDPMFSQRLLGDGVAFKASSGEVYAPADGEVTNSFPSMHAITLITCDGAELLIHIGIDTVELEGRGFRSLVAKNARVKAGDKLLEFDQGLISSCGYDDTVILVVTNSDQYQKIEILPVSRVKPGNPVIELTR